MSRIQKSVLGAFIGASSAGMWLIVDLLLPEPIGDYLLFLIMGVVNMVIGWQVARLVGKHKENSLPKTSENLKTSDI
ncbi:hypothetical protein E1I69_12125 [Bacillus timonensis]|uniref:Uncharacterized protein n=1 Tax=Bacillus timonensis TaxID=1033734 RepID=A0A4S3PRU3_9BACI|nr:hypothetical protein [Bacillus timonensis]THE12094.1 hypothetical protein E1I69_12125 [Bacillus timonensis]